MPARVTRRAPFLPPPPRGVSATSSSPSETSLDELTNGAVSRRRTCESEGTYDSLPPSMSTENRCVF